MTRLLRNPLGYLVAGEVCVLIALAVAAWHLIPHPAPQAALNPSLSAPDPSLQPTPEPPPAVPTQRPRPASSPAPGTPPAAAAATSDPAFWTARLSELNRDQSALQRAQWSLIDTALAAARRYLDSVVVPAVEQAARDHRPRTQTSAG